MNDLKISQMKTGKAFLDALRCWTSKRSSRNVSVRLKNSGQFAQAAQKHYEVSLDNDAVITKNHRSVVYMRTNILV